MQRELTLIPRLTIHPQKIIAYNEVHWNPGKPHKDPKALSQAQLENVENNLKKSTRSADGFVSPNAQKKIEKALDYLFFLAKPTRQFNVYTKRWFDFKTCFLTLTLPAKQMHSDNEIKRLALNHFLTVLRNEFKVKNYVWRAEKQQNGNIHFHFILDKFIFHTTIRDAWNSILDKLGYIEAYRQDKKQWYEDGFRVYEESLVRWNKKKQQFEPHWTIDKQKNSYRKGVTENWSNPNTVDIHSIQYIKKIKSYVTKYMLKDPEIDLNKSQEENEKLLVQGRLWGCNVDLSQVTGAQVDMDHFLHDELTQLIKETKCFKIEDTYYSIFYIDFKKVTARSSPNLFQCFIQYLNTTFNYDYQIEMFYP